MIRLSLAFLPVFALLSGSLSAETIDFNRDIRPILSQNCFQCHGPDEATREAGLRLDLEDAAKEDLGGYKAIHAGDAEASEIVYRMTTDDEIDLMPPPESNLTLTATEIETLKQWIDQGAPWAEHWSFVEVQRPEIPEASDPEWPQNEIDYFVLQRLEAEKLAPSDHASRETLIRRVTLALTGLPPTLEEVDAFLVDESPEAFQKVLDRLFASPRYGEHMTWHWLEAARYADTDGYQNDGPRDMWRWRDWVIDAWNANMPYDQFSIEQLAGDLLPDPTPDQLIATGFNRNHRYNSEAGLVLEEFLLENAVDRVDTTSTVWMGLTTSCARCHDHKYDPISQKEYYQLIDFFNDVPESGRAIKFGNSEPWIKAPTDEQAVKLAGLEKKAVDAAAALETALPEIEKAMETWKPAATDALLLSEGLTVHHPFDEKSDALKIDKGQPSFVDGVHGKAVHFDGESSFKTGKVENLITNSRFSMSFWIHPDKGSEGTILSNETGDTTRKGLFVALVDGGRLRFSINTRWIAGVSMLDTHRFIPANEWTHVLLTNDGTQRADGMAIYLNGEKAETIERHNTNSNKGSANFGGEMRYGDSLHLPAYRGKLDDLRIYNQDTLTEREARILAVTESIPELKAIPAAQRSAPQQEALQAWYLQQEAPAEFQQLLTARNKTEQALQEYEDGLPTLMIMKDADVPIPSYVRERGLYDQLGEQVEPAVLAVFPDIPEDAPRNRLGFAQWLMSPEHPLTARVTVNRYWQKLFGRGLVATPEDFGAQGDLPSHPKLLDWLAAEYMESGWDTQHLLGLILSSATWQQSSTVDPDKLEKDPHNILLARAPRMRMTGNQLRDQALKVSGLLVEKQGGPSVKPYQPANLWREASNTSYRPDKGDALYRRSLYTYWKRTLAPPSMAILDTADREWCSVRPKETNTPLQALTLLNETAFFESARKLAERILLEGGESRQDQINYAFRTVTSRDPLPQETQILSEAWDTYHEKFSVSPTDAETTLTIGESPASPELDPIDIAAATALANVLLNLDEVTTRE